MEFCIIKNKERDINMCIYTYTLDIYNKLIYKKISKPP